MNDLKDAAYVPSKHPLITRIYGNAGIPEADIDGRIKYLMDSILGRVFDRDYRKHVKRLEADQGRVYVLNMLERLTIGFCSDDVLL